MLDTLQLQYTRGPLQIATWAHLTNAHLLPGPSIVNALHEAANNTLTSMNQSVATTITSGSQLPNPGIGVNPHSTADADLALSDPAVDGANAEPSQADTSSAASDTGEDHLVFSHTRSLSGAVSATTTISQSFEPISPPAHPSLVKSLSQGEEFQRNPAKALVELGPPPHARGLLLLAEMSSEGNLMTPAYTQTCVEAAQQDKEFVLGFISQRSLNSKPGDNFINLTPGVTLPPEGEDEQALTGDGKGQQWRGPREVIGRDGADVVIVGRGILKADDRRRAAQRYQQAAWAAYEERIGRK